MNRLFDPPTAPCHVCNEEITTIHYAECMVCTRAFHLRMTESDQDAKDCGSIEVDENYGTIFTCNTCLEEEQSGAPAPPLLYY